MFRFRRLTFSQAVLPSSFRQHIQRQEFRSSLSQRGSRTQAGTPHPDVSLRCGSMAEQSSKQVMAAFDAFPLGAFFLPKTPMAKATLLGFQRTGSRLS